MHGEAEVHGTVQIGRGLGLAQSRAGDSEVVHADIIGTGGDDLRGKVDTLPTVTLGSCNLSQMCSHVQGHRCHPKSHGSL